jgi:hypothetical protein
MIDLKNLICHFNFPPSHSFIDILNHNSNHSISHTRSFILSSTPQWYDFASLIVLCIWGWSNSFTNTGQYSTWSWSKGGSNLLNLVLQVLDANSFSLNLSFGLSCKILGLLHKSFKYSLFSWLKLCVAKPGGTACAEGFCWF